MTGIPYVLIDLETTEKQVKIPIFIFKSEFNANFKPLNSN